MLGKTRTAVSSLAAFVSSVLTGAPAVIFALAGPGYHRALSHRHRLRLLQRRRPGLRHRAMPRQD